MDADIRYEEGRSRWPTRVEEWEDATPRFISRLKGLLTYGTSNIPLQVNPWGVGPIMARGYLKDGFSLGIHSQRAKLRFSKSGINEMSFMCGFISPKNKNYYSGLIVYDSGDPLLYLHHLDSSTWDVANSGTEGILCKRVIQVIKL